MNFKYLLVLLGFISTQNILVGQEELGELPYRAEQYKSALATETKYGSRAEGDTSITYLYNTLELPIIDDFSKNHLKYFPTSVSHPSVFDSLSYRFVVDDIPVDTAKFMINPVYNYRVDPVTGNLDSSMADSINIVFFNDQLVFFRVDSFRAFPSYSTYTQNGITRIINYPPDSIIVNKSKSNFFARDDDFSYWIAPGPFLNQTMAKDQPTIGVLTFDGLDSTGRPYDASSRLTYGISDYLISKPINLYDYEVSVGNRNRYIVNDSVYLSFFYEPEGNGDRPEAEDSLILDFYNVISGKWNRVWGVPGDTSTSFKRVSIHISDTFYLQNGFRFRFKNYATQSGNFDHWHLDYIRLIKDGGRNDEIIDFAIVNPVRSLLTDYTSMPWEHYKVNPSDYMIDTVNLDHINLSTKTDVLKARYKIYKAGKINYLYVSPEELRTSVFDKTTLSFEVKSSNRFEFPKDNLERQWFRCRFETFSSADKNFRFNDTLEHVQIFDRYYSYDDRSAEKTYHLNLVGTNLAIKFNSPIKDTLKSVLINFIQTFEKIENQKVNIKVYKDLSAAPIFESGPIKVEKNAPGNFQRYQIPEVLEVEGDFYVGWEQVSKEKTYVGYDINYNNKDNTYISEVEGVWFNSNFSGTVMIRADFGDGSEKPLSKKEVKTENRPISIFPNPTNESFQLQGVKEKSTVLLYNLQGAAVKSWTFEENVQYNIADLKTGIYLLIAINRAGNPVTNKLVITN